MRRKQMSKITLPEYPHGGNGGNGGWNNRKAMADGLDKPLKLNHSGKFAATGVTKKK